MTIRALLVVAMLEVAACRLPYAGGARPIDSATIDENWHSATATPIVRQRDRKDCGLAALAMVAGAWGHYWTMTQLAEDIPPTKTGVKLGSLRDYARRRGLVAYAIRGTHDDLMFELARHRPVLLGLVLPFAKDRAISHYEVVVALDRRDGTVVTLDPATGTYMRRTRDVLEAEWKAAGYATLVVVGTAASGLAGP
jgi:ABC-type bacteriocin/lantibiotic exporter with double-glycine peptidase domain